MPLALVFALNSAEAGVVHADVAEYLSGQLIFGIVAFRLFLEVNAAQVQRMNARRNLRLGFTCQPAESLVSPAAGEEFAWILLGDMRDKRNCAGGVRHLGGNSEHRVHRNRHGKLSALVVANDSAFG